jgi:hypothetical protein
MKMKRINKGAFNTFLIFLSLVGITSSNITNDWATAISQGLVAGFVSAFIYIVGYSMGIEDGKAEGYEKAFEDLKPLLPPEIKESDSTLDL